jgi:hypothetical protein
MGPEVLAHLPLAQAAVRPEGAQEPGGVLAGEVRAQRGVAPGDRGQAGAVTDSPFWRTLSFCPPSADPPGKTDDKQFRALIPEGDRHTVNTAVRSVQPPAPAWPISCSWAIPFRSASSSAADW